jgi:hypothetical protein
LTKGELMFLIETNDFGKIAIDNNINKFEKKIPIGDDSFIYVNFQNLIEMITIDNINSLKIILDSYYKIKANSEKYIIENYNKNDKIRYYFEDLFAEKIGGTLEAYIKIRTGDTEELYRLMELPIEEKITFMSLPYLLIFYNKEKQYDVRLIFNSVENEYKTSLWFHYDINLNLNKFWVDEIDPWK